MNALFESSNSHLSALFFVSLTLVMDLLGINFIIANATREYKLFCAEVLSNRLDNRKAALDAIYDAYSVPLSTVQSAKARQLGEKKDIKNNNELRQQDASKSDLTENFDIMVLRLEDWVS